MKLPVIASLVGGLLFVQVGNAKPPRPCFSQLDSNSDDVLSYAELSVDLPPHHNADELFSLMDADGDEGITKTEFYQFKPQGKPNFNTLDTNADGLVSFSEFSQVPAPHGDAQTAFNRIDTDGSGDITQAEFDAHHSEMQQRKPHIGNKMKADKTMTGECND